MTSARRAAAGEAAPPLLAAGIAIATAVSFLRIIALAGFVNPVLLSMLAAPLAMAALAAVGYAVLTVHRHGGGKDDMPAETGFRNPFAFWPVVGFAVFLGVIIVAGRAVAQNFGAGGALVGAVAIGLADVDSITISMGHLVPEPLGLSVASAAILAAVASNMTSKLALSVAIGRGRFAVEVALMTAACWVAGAIGVWASLTLAGR
jgi:uncharacterized membrane protein (DUF4010 family)